MEIILEDENIILYRGFFSGVDFEVSLRKDSGEATLVISSSILNNPNYKTFYLKAYKDTIKRFKNIKELSLQFVPLNDEEEKRSQELVSSFSFSNDSKIIRKQKGQVFLENYFKTNLISESQDGITRTYLQDGANSFVNVSYLEIERKISTLFQDKELDLENQPLNVLVDRVVSQLERGQKREVSQTKPKTLVRKNNEGIIDAQTFLLLILVMGILMGSLYYFIAQNKCRY